MGVAVGVVVGFGLGTLPSRTITGKKTTFVIALVTVLVTVEIGCPVVVGCGVGVIVGVGVIIGVSIGVKVGVGDGQLLPPVA